MNEGTTKGIIIFFTWLQIQQEWNTIYETFYKMLHLIDRNVINVSYTMDHESCDPMYIPDHTGTILS